MVVRSRRDFSGFGTRSMGVMSPTRDSAMSWTRARRVQRGMLRWARKGVGARRVSMDILYLGVLRFVNLFSLSFFAGRMLMVVV